MSERSAGLKTTWLPVESMQNLSLQKRSTAPPPLCVVC